MESKVPAWRLSSTHCGGRRAPREEDTGARDKGPAVPRRCAAGTECPIQRRDGEGSAVLQAPSRRLSVSHAGQCPGRPFAEPLEGRLGVGQAPAHMDSIWGDAVGETKGQGCHSILVACAGFWSLRGDMTQDSACESERVRSEAAPGLGGPGKWAALACGHRRRARLSVARCLAP